MLTLTSTRQRQIKSYPVKPPPPDSSSPFSRADYPRAKHVRTIRIRFHSERKIRRTVSSSTRSSAFEADSRCELHCVAAEPKGDGVEAEMCQSLSFPEEEHTDSSVLDAARHNQSHQLKNIIDNYSRDEDVAVWDAAAHPEAPLGCGYGIWMAFIDPYCNEYASCCTIVSGDVRSLTPFCCPESSMGESRTRLLAGAFLASWSARKEELFAFGMIVGAPKPPRRSTYRNPSKRSAWRFAQPHLTPLSRTSAFRQKTLQKRLQMASRVRA
uniref:Uncharacterized protein n=1 Tax=Steinernema glaseri TaxID=37863 RepID=A0A1I8AF04_9BILA